MDAIKMFIEYLENDIKFDKESNIKNKQIKDILFYEKSRILQKAKFLQKYCTPDSKARIIKDL